MPLFWLMKLFAVIENGVPEFNVRSARVTDRRRAAEAVQLAEAIGRRREREQR